MNHKVVVNKCYGGFGLSFKAVAYIFDNMSQEEKYEMRKDYKKESETDFWNIKKHIGANIENLPRHHKLLVEAVEKFGKEAGSKFCIPVIVHINGSRYMIEAYDGFENIVYPEDIQWIDIE